MEPVAEHRVAQRRTTLKVGHIVFNNGRSTIDCTVRNLSAKGAKLLVASVVGIPDTFDLMLDGHTRQPCRVAWRRLKELGVSFNLDA
ncbi:MAG: PilZ domain-containing protein [Devosia sp.]|nr:PilZ domain-containing protein [Devosia sp.]